MSNGNSNGNSNSNDEMQALQLLVYILLLHGGLLTIVWLLLLVSK